VYWYLEGLVVGEGVDDDKALAVLDVEVAHAGELLGAGRVQDLQHAGTAVHLDLLQKKGKIRRCYLEDNYEKEQIRGENEKEKERTMGR
jgi:hypothetical protein